MKKAIYRITAAAVLLTASTAATADIVWIWKWLTFGSNAAYVGGNQVR